jgi:thiol-disulfide isomerase/thioredoxin
MLKFTKKYYKMLFFIIIISASIGLLVWSQFIEDDEIKIPESKNINFNDEAATPIDVSTLEGEFEKYDRKPILLYIYTTWCGTCKKNFHTINDIAREFQNTELKVIALAIDRNIGGKDLSDVLRDYGNIYFEPKFLNFREGFVDFLKKRGIKYEGRVPFTALISRDGTIITKFSGIKRTSYLRKKIIKELYQT